MLEGFHILYTCTREEECIHLCSSDKTLYCIHPVILKSASTFFQSTLPSRLQNGVTAELKVEIKETIQLSEPSEVLDVLLSVSRGWAFDIAKVVSIEQMLDVLSAAEKYEMNGVISTIRHSALSPLSPFHGHPLQLAQACHQHSWSNEYRIALERTLSLDISAPEVYSELSSLDGAVVANICRLRHLVTERFKKSLFSSEDDYRYSKSDWGLAWEPISECKGRRSQVFMRWKSLVVSEFAIYPSGQTVRDEGSSFFSRQTVTSLFGSLTCHNLGSVHKHDLDPAQMSWMVILRRVLAEVALSFPSDLDSCLQLGTTTGPTPRVLEEEESGRSDSTQDSDEDTLKGTFHRQFACTSEIGSIHLRSKNGRLYCIHSAVLKSASGFFRSTLPPHEDKACKSEGELSGKPSIQLSEPSGLVEVLVGAASGQALDIAAMPTTGHIRDILSAAQKYEMRGLVSMTQYSILSPRSPFHDKPLQFALVCHRNGWSDEYRIALERTMPLDISDPEVYSTLCALDGVVVANILRLRSLRVKRLKDKLSIATDDLSYIGNDPAFQATKRSICAARRSEVFLRWKWLVIEEFAAHPEGHTLLKEAFSSDSRLGGLRCDCVHSGQAHDHDLKIAIMSWVATLRNILESITSELAKDIGVCLGTIPMKRRKKEA